MSMTQYPQELDWAYRPKVGDKIERTNREDGTVVTGTVARVLNHGAESLEAVSSSGFMLWITEWSYASWSLRLLSVKPKVGDIVSSINASDYPAGTVFKQTAGGRKLLSVCTDAYRKDLRYLKDAFTGNAWPRLTSSKGQKYRIEYLPGDDNA